MKKCLVLILLVAMSLSACKYDLGETNGAFYTNGEIGSNQTCEHALIYDFATNHDQYGIYNNAEFHYVMCGNKLYGNNCDFIATFERHTRHFTFFSSLPILLYNAQYYHVANFSCEVCKSEFAGSVYVRCTDNKSSCSADCDGATSYIKEMS